MTYHHQQHAIKHPKGQTDLVTDPICKMHITPDEAAVIRILEDHIDYFCSQECAREFDGRQEQHERRSS